MKDNKICGIYKITNTANEKFYLGSSIQANRRWRQHKDDLRHGRHHSVILQRAWDKYGEATFSFEILELCERDNLLEREQHYMDALKPHYNVEKKAGKPPQHPEISSRTMKAQWAAGQFDNQKKPVDRINPTTGEITEYPSMADAEKDGFDQRTISACCLGKKLSYANYHWQFSDGSSPEPQAKYQKVFHSVVGTNIETNEQIILNSFDDCNNLGLNYGKIRAVCEGKRGRRTHKGYRWKFVNYSKQEIAALNSYPTFQQVFAKAIKQLTIDGQLVRLYMSQAETKIAGFDQRKVSACCLGKRKTHRGFKWEFA